MALLPTALPNSLSDLNPFGPGHSSSQEGPALMIQELTGQKRSLKLRGRALPYRPVSFGATSQRSKKTTYQGNPEATQQVLGPEEGDCSMRGMWKDRFIRGQVEQVGFRTVLSAADLVEFFRDMVSAGQTIQVQWGPEIRIGLIKRIEPTWHRIMDVEFELDFEWKSRGAVTTRVPVAKVSAPSLLDKLNRVADIFAIGPEFIFPDVNAMLVSAIAETRQKVARIFDAIRGVQKIGQLPGDVLGAIASNAQSLRFQLLQTINNLAEVPVSLISASQYATDNLSAEVWARELSEAFMNLLDSVGLIQEQAEAQAKPPALQVFTVRQASSLYQVSVQFYGTADFAGFIGDVNGISEAILVPGTVLIIPPKPNNTEG